MKIIRNNGINDPTINLALEEYCVRNLNMNDDYLLFYINEPSIIIGKHQNTIEEINSGYVNENGIQVVRRISGGGAVYHDKGNLNFSFMTKYSNESIHNFKYFTGPVIKVLAELGVNAELNGRNDITVSDRKISGNAQFTDTKSMFSHGTLLFDSHLEDVAKALNVRIDKIESKGIKSVRSRVANITEFLSHKMSIDEFRQKIIDSIFSNQDSVEYFELSDEQWSDVMNLSESKYRNWDWNYGRSPEFNIQKVKRFDFGQIDARINVKDGVINSIKIYGDFLGHGELEDLEKKLMNKKYEKEALLNSLSEFNLNMYLGKISGDEFSAFLCE
ncbi:MAG: lipoate--protein ligase [Ignavibacteria bacterium]|nr:lipoate--protein ligase [Ignavibacteria bacterium]MBK9228195.1 lipoate--protein ligase [Ignavibacteria bacterium]